MRVMRQSILSFALGCLFVSHGFAETKTPETWQNWNVQTCLENYRPQDLLNSFGRESVRIQKLISEAEAKGQTNRPLTKAFEEFSRQYAEWKNDYIRQVYFLGATARACYNAEGECLCGSNRAIVNVPRSLERIGFSQSDASFLYRLLGLDNDRDLSSGAPQDARCIFANSGLTGQQTEVLLRPENQSSSILWNLLKARHAQMICNRIKSEEENWILVTVIRKSFDQGNSDRFQAQQKFYDFRSKYLDLLKKAATLEGANEPLSFSP